MALTEIGGRWARQRRTEFARRGPWGALFARSGNNNTTTKGTDGDLTRRWAHGPANYSIIGVVIIIFILTAPRIPPRASW